MVCAGKGQTQWEAKDDSERPNTGPKHTNNQTLEGNPKMDKFEQHDSAGAGHDHYCHDRGFHRAYSIVHQHRQGCRQLQKRNAMKAQNVTDKQEAKERADR